MDLLESRAILRELLRRKKTPNLFNTAFDKQKEFINHPCRLKAALTTRRAGKSYAAGLYLFKEALMTDGVSCLYIALTRESAKKIMWRDILKQIDRFNHFGAAFNETTLTLTLPNNSAIYLAGADAKPDEMEKFLGMKNKLIILDEAGSFHQDTRRLVYSILRPTTVDLNGTIAMIGTPSDLINNSLFYDVTGSEKEKGWAVFKWSALDNPYIADNWKEDIDLQIANNPKIVETPSFRQMYLGEWYIDTSKLVYKFNREDNVYESLPTGKLYYVIGCDLGYEDDTAMVVCCYSDREPVLYVVECFNQKKMIVSDVANKLKQLQDKYNAGRIVIDNANKQAVEEMKRRYQLALTPADKTGKTDFIEIMNSDMICSKLKIKLPDCQPLADEWLNLIWDDRDFKKQEHPACDNHLADACLYAWRYCYQYAWRIEPYEPPINSAEYMKELYWERQAEKYIKAQEENELI